MIQHVKMALQETEEAGLRAFAEDVCQGLGAPRKWLKCKYFYDQRGAALFDRICKLPEYYLTRTELQIMQRYVSEMAEAIGPDVAIIELGAGSGLKTRLLLDHLPGAAGYVPIDIAEDQLQRTAEAMRAVYPHLEIIPLCADFTDQFTLPELTAAWCRRCIYFPGSTIGNFNPDETADLLHRLHRLINAGGMLLIGVDLLKDPSLLHSAYNDSSGVTAAFNLNLLYRINRELDGTFAPEKFAHYAFFNPDHGRIEMHLVSRARQEVVAAGHRFTFRSAESILTERSYKYDPQEFAEIAVSAGFRLHRQWTDDRRWFAVQLYTA